MQATTNGHRREDASRVMPDEVPPSAQETHGFNGTTNVSRERRLSRFPRTKYSLDHSILKCINHFARRHKFFTEHSFTKYTTSQRRSFERDVYDYARAIGLSKAQAKASMVHARQLCGEEEYDSDNTKLDEDEIDDSPTLLVTLPASTGHVSGDAHVSPTEQERDSQSGSGKRSGDQMEDQSRKRKKADGAPTFSEGVLPQTRDDSRIISRTTMAMSSPTIPNSQTPSFLGVVDNVKAWKEPTNTNEKRQNGAHDPSSAPRAQTIEAQPNPTEGNHEEDGQIALVRQGERTLADNPEMGYAQVPQVARAGDDRIPSLVSQPATNETVAKENPHPKKADQRIQQQRAEVKELHSDDIMEAKCRSNKRTERALRNIILELLKIETADDLDADVSHEILSVAHLWKNKSALSKSMKKNLLSLFGGLALSYLNIEKFDEIDMRWAEVENLQSSTSVETKNWAYYKKVARIKDRVMQGLLQCFEDIARKRLGSKTRFFLKKNLKEALDPFVEQIFCYHDFDESAVAMTFKIQSFAREYYQYLLRTEEPFHDSQQDSADTKVIADLASVIKEGLNDTPTPDQEVNLSERYNKISNAWRSVASSDPRLPRAEIHKTLSADTIVSGDNGNLSNNRPTGIAVENETPQKVSHVARDPSFGAAEQCKQSEGGPSTSNEQSKGNRLSNPGEKSDKRSIVESEHSTKTASPEEDENPQATKQFDGDDQSFVSVKNEEDEQVVAAEYQGSYARNYTLLSKATDKPLCTSQSLPSKKAAKHCNPPIPSKCRFCQETFSSKNALFRHLHSFPLHRKLGTHTKLNQSEGKGDSKPTNTTDPSSKHRKLKKSDVRHSDGPLSISRDFQNPMIQ